MRLIEGPLKVTWLRVRIMVNGLYIWRSQSGETPLCIVGTKLHVKKDSLSCSFPSFDFLKTNTENKTPSRVRILPLDSKSERAKEVCTLRASPCFEIKWCLPESSIQGYCIALYRILIKEVRQSNCYRNSHVLTSTVLSGKMVLLTGTNCES